MSFGNKPVVYHENLMMPDLDDLNYVKEKLFKYATALKLLFAAFEFESQDYDDVVFLHVAVRGHMADVQEFKLGLMSIVGT